MVRKTENKEEKATLPSDEDIESIKFSRKKTGINKNSGRD